MPPWPLGSYDFKRGHKIDLPEANSLLTCCFLRVVVLFCHGSVKGKPSSASVKSHLV